MDIVKKFSLVLLSIVISYFFAIPLGGWYLNLIEDNGSFIDARFFAGFPLAYIFSLTLLLVVFGGKHKYWWLGLLLIPAIIFELYFDSAHFYFPLVLGLLGWLVGVGVFKVLESRSNI